MLKIGLGITALLLLTRGVFEPTQLAVTEIALPEGPQATIAVYSDLHLAKGRAPLAKLKKALADLEPDLVFALGDFSERPLDQHELAYLSSLASLAPTFGVLGNNDTSPELVRQLERAGLTILQNQGVRLSFQQGDIYIYGVEDVRAGKPSLSGLAGAASGDCVILLSHSPEIINQLTDQKVDLILSGHTHGGQICLPTGQAVITHSKLGPKYDSGLFSLDNAKLVITRGVGTSGLPFRRFCLPELVVLRLGR